MAVAAPSTLVGRICIIGGAGEPAGRLEQLLNGQGYVVWSAGDAAQTAGPLYPAPDVVLIDARADAGVAAAAVTAARGEQRLATTIPLVLLPALPEAPLLGLLSAAAADFLVAPVADAELLGRLTLAVGRSEQRRRDLHERARLAEEQTAQWRALDEQRARAARLQAIFERLPIGVVVVSPTNQIEAVNPAYCRFLGYSADELTGRQPGFVTPPEDQLTTIAQGHQLAAGQIDQFVHERQRHLRKDGSLILGRLTSHALRDDHGRPQAYLAFVEDISGRVLIEDQLARQTRYQQALADASLSLLSVAPDAPARAEALRRALQQLVDGAATSRAYLFRNVQDPAFGLGMSAVAEAWSAGQRPFRELGGAKIFSVLPYALLPEAHRQRMLAPLPAGGLVDELYGESPQLCATIQADGILSTQTVPVMVNGAHWGFVGLDDHTQPRVWDHTDLTLLTTAATMLGQTLHRWQIEDDLHATSRLLHTTGQVARVGGWAFDLASSALTISEELAELLEVAPDAIGDFAALLAFCAPDGRPALQEAAQAAISSGEGWDVFVKRIVDHLISEMFTSTSLR